MARALSQIMSELEATYSPQKQLYNKYIGELDPQMEAEQKGLESQQEDSFNQITQGANRRGLLFSGIPLEEQAKYTGSSFLPAIAALRGKYATNRFNLQQALAGINTEQSNRAQDLYNTEVNQDLAREQAARAGSAGSSAPSFSFGGAETPTATGYTNVAGVTVKPEDQMLYNQMFVKGDGSQWSAQDLVNDYNATLASARYGNQRDIQKINFYHTFRPDIFGSQVPSLSRAANAGSGGGGW